MHIDSKAYNDPIKCLENYASNSEVSLKKSCVTLVKRTCNTGTKLKTSLYFLKRLMAVSNSTFPYSIQRSNKCQLLRFQINLNNPDNWQANSSCLLLLINNYRMWLASLEKKFLSSLLETAWYGLIVCSARTIWMAHIHRKFFENIPQTSNMEGEVCIQ